jgi:hypothetical protein
MLKVGTSIVAAAGLLLCAIVMTQCSKPAQPPAPATAAPSSNQALLGDMKAVVSVKELMQYMIDPMADNIFEAVWTDITPKGNVDHRPRTEDDWENVKTAAVSLSEGIYLLKVPRPFAPPGDVNNSTGPTPSELSPTQIKAMVDKDPVTWNAKIEALRNVGREVLDIVNHVGSQPILRLDPLARMHGRSMGSQKDVDDLFQAAEDLDNACESCHLQYWYPGDKKDEVGTRR